MLKFANGLSLPKSHVLKGGVSATLLICVLLFVSGTALAATATVANPNPQVGCTDGFQVLADPYTKDGTDYYCAKLPDGSYTPGAPGADGKCPSGQPSIPDSNGQKTCIKFTSDPTVIKGIPRAGDPFADTSSGGGAITQDIKDIANFLAVGVGVIVTIMIVVGGIQYSAAGGDPQAIANAKKKIYNAIFALVAFAFMWALLQFLIPGGPF